MRVTVDASVWVASQLSGDAHHAQATRFIESCLALRIIVIVPELVLLEVAAAVARLTQDAGPGQIAARKLERFPRVQFRTLERRSLERAILLATRHRLRGADAIYVATAREARATLVTLDEEMLQRGAAAVATVSPETWLKQTASTRSTAAKQEGTGPLAE